MWRIDFLFFFLFYACTKLTFFFRRSPATKEPSDNDLNLTWLSGRIWYVNSTPWMVISPRKVRSSTTIPRLMSISGTESMRLNTRCAAPAALVKLHVSIGPRRTKRLTNQAIRERSEKRDGKTKRKGARVKRYSRELNEYSRSRYVRTVMIEVSTQGQTISRALCWRERSKKSHEGEQQCAKSRNVWLNEHQEHLRQRLTLKKKVNIYASLATFFFLLLAQQPKQALRGHAVQRREAMTCLPPPTKEGQGCAETFGEGSSTTSSAPWLDEGHCVQ